MTSRTSKTTPNICDNRDNGALSSVDMSSNNVFQNVKDEEAMPSIAAALKGNTTLTSFNISNNYMKAIHAKLLALAIQDNGAMSILNVSKNNIGVEGAKALASAM